MDMSEAKKKDQLPACPVETTLTLIGDKWKVLAAQLRDMEKSGLVHREVYAEVPPRVEYTLTELGYSLKPILDAMWTWGEAYKSSRGAAPAQPPAETEAADAL